MARYYSDMVHLRTCVYRAYDADANLLYVGMSIDPQRRMLKHRSSAWWPHVDEITVQWFAGREAAKAAEREAISSEEPIYNRARPIQPFRMREVF